MSCRCQPKEGGTACITSLASPPAMRRQALRIKTGSESKLGQHAMIPLSGQKTAPMLGDRGGVAELLQIDTIKESEVKNGWCFVPGRDTLSPGLKKYKSKLS